MRRRPLLPHGLRIAMAALTGVLISSLARKRRERALAILRNVEASARSLSQWRAGPMDIEHVLSEHRLLFSVHWAMLLV